ncbi:MAG: hypothetical protein L0Y72_08370 [Gemmataceae bacterium]|nr:hypothetical protein [Gemmataceae bacterium]MCI0739044.1 hypothetical protein [Gemmataceae bacterium]
MPPETGKIVFFMVVLAAAAVVGSYYGVLAAHYFLTVIEHTGAGADEIRFPNDPVFDYITKPFYLVGLCLVWIVIGWLILVNVNPEFARSLAGVAALLAGVFWLTFPISLLSSMSAQSQYVILYTPLLRQLLQRPGGLILFYLATLPHVAALVVIVFVSIYWNFLLVPLAAPVLAALLLMHARVLGRFAWLIGFLTPVKEKVEVKKIPEVYNLPRPDAGAGEPSAEESAPETESPSWPEEVDDEWAKVKNPYGIMSEEQAKKSYAKKRPTAPRPSTRTRSEEDSGDGYKVSAATESPNKVPLDSFLRPEKPKQDMPPAEGHWLFFAGNYAFPFYPHSLRPFCLLTILGFFFLCCLRALVYTFP